MSDNTNLAKLFEFTVRLNNGRETMPYYLEELVSSISLLNHSNWDVEAALKKIDDENGGHHDYLTAEQFNEASFGQAVHPSLPNYFDRIYTMLYKTDQQQPTTEVVAPST